MNAEQDFAEMCHRRSGEILKRLDNGFRDVGEKFDTLNGQVVEQGNRLTAVETTQGVHGREIKTNKRDIAANKATLMQRAGQFTALIVVASSVFALMRWVLG